MGTVIRERHGVPGQLNVCVLDVESEVTNYGKHNRLVVFRGTGVESQFIYIREDIRDLPESTELDRMRIARHLWHRLHPAGSRLKHMSSERYGGILGPAIEHQYEIVGGHR